ncbi:hypothetical protein HOLleu_35595 [Holothuria leucospilota]|uniref:Uncharacterized protein n=1 Tax=Holothuria leucospilota TaxID=206669 RepID=A0A9Q1BF71_HOLLE|nr:hypothetical protein HOLleu_35595 [Holothuria leucospilota]
MEKLTQDQLTRKSLFELWKSETTSEEKRSQSILKSKEDWLRNLPSQEENNTTAPDYPSQHDRTYPRPRVPTDGQYHHPRRSFRKAHYVHRNGHFDTHSQPSPTPRFYQTSITATFTPHHRAHRAQHRNTYQSPTALPGKTTREKQL